MAEAHVLSNAVEHGLRTRAAIVDTRRQLNIRQWEETAPAAMGHVWFTDCESFFSKLISPNTKQVDNKRLAWDNRDDCDEEVEIEGRSSSLDRHDRAAVRLLDEDDDILSIERNNEYWYLRYETY